MVFLPQRIPQLTHLNSNLGTEFVTIYVGKEQKEYIVHKQVICNTADYFSKAFTGAFQERVGVMHLPEETSDAFGLFVHWLYKGEVPLIHTQNYLERLFKLYVFAEKLCLVELANRTMNRIRRICGCNPKAETKASMVSYAFQNTFTDSPIREWALQDYVRHLDKSKFSGIPTGKDSDGLRLLCRENDDIFQDYLNLLRNLGPGKQVPNARFGDSGKVDDSSCKFHRHKMNEACHVQETQAPVFISWVSSSELF